MSGARFIKLILALALAALAPLASQGATLIYTNDLLGELEPCGCRTNPMGGVVREKNLISKQKDPSILKLDAGDTFFGSDTIAPALEAQSKIQAEYLAKALQEIRLDAIVPGEKDFALGYSFFEKISAKMPFVAANLLHNGKPFLKPSRVFTMKDGTKPLKVAVLGLVGEKLGWPKGVSASSAVASAKKLVPALRKNADLVIVLSHQGYDADVTLAKAVTGIDLIVGAHSQSFLQNTPKFGMTRLYQSSFRNQYIGVLPLHKKFTGEGHELVGLDANYEDPASPLVKTVSDFKAKVAEVNSKEDAKLFQESEKAFKSGKKFQTFTKCSECHLKQFEFWRKTLHADALTVLAERSQLKNKECLSCHTVGLGDPLGFSTVSQITARIKPGQKLAEGENPAEEPVLIDTMKDYLHELHEAKDLDSEVKFVDGSHVSARKSFLTLTRSYAPVQCENCHQSGADHPFSGHYTKTVDKSVCLKCHTPDRAPEWYQKNGQLDEAKYASKRSIVQCPAGNLEEN